MMSFLTYIMGFFMNFELLPILTDYANYKKGGMKFKKKSSPLSNDYFIKILFLLSKLFQTRRFLWEFPIGSFVKLSSTVAAILVGVLKCRTKFWKRTTQESFQQSLVEIGSVLSEEKIFF
jgi:hypothetical protein